MLDQVYSTLFRSAIFPMMEGPLRGRATAPLLAYLEESQWRPLDELVAFQEGELRRLVLHAQRNVPHYGKTFAGRGVDARTIHTVADLHRLPILTRDDAYRFAADRKSVTGPAIAIEKATGGTTGEPLKFGYERSSEYWRQAMKWRGYGWAGYRPGDTTLHYWGASTAATTRGRAWKVKADRAFRREHYFDCHHRSEAEMRAVVDAIVRLSPRIMLCYTSAGVDLANFINDRGLRQWDSLRVICGAERLLPQHRPAMEAAFGPVVFETYGSREVMLMGSECEAHDGLHQSMENIIVEIVVREGDRTRAARPGELGEVLITDLHNYAMPFIRYANGDLAMQRDDDVCRCGRRLRRFGPVEGRVAETLTDGNGAKVNGLVFNVVFTNYANVVKQFQAVQHVDKSVTLKVVLARPLTEAEQADIRKHLDKYLPATKLTMAPVDEIPPGKNGKRRVAIVET